MFILFARLLSIINYVKEKLNDRYPEARRANSAGPIFNESANYFSFIIKVVMPPSPSPEVLSTSTLTTTQSFSFLPYFSSCSFLLTVWSCDSRLTQAEYIGLETKSCRISYCKLTVKYDRT